MTSNSTQATPGVVFTDTVAALEKIPHAARRMSVSVSQFYRIAKRDGLRIIKVSERSSAVIASEVDTWIQKRVAACSGVAK